MNHLGDTNKMVSDTLRTDELLTAMLDVYGYVHQGNCPQQWVNYARELERELNAANTEIEEKRKDVVWLATEKAKLENYVMRLEEAGDTMANAYRQICYDAYDNQQVDNWFKAKEAKP